MDAERADHVVRLAETKLGPSGLALRRGDKMEEQKCAVPLQCNGKVHV